MLIVGCCHSFVGVIAKLKEGAENVQTKLQAKVEGVGFKPINPETASRGDSLWYLWLVLFLTLFRLAVLAVYFLLVLPISCFFIFFQNFIFLFQESIENSYDTFYSFYFTVLSSFYFHTHSSFIIYNLLLCTVLCVCV